VIGLSTNEAGPAGYNPELFASLAKRAQERTDATTGVPFNVANWPISYDGLLLYADILRRAGIDGSTDPQKARELIKDQFMAFKEFSGVFKYSLHNTGDGYIPAIVLTADPANKKWRLAGKH
jgi:hypothetical protein